MPSPIVNPAFVYALGKRPVRTEITEVNGDGVPDVFVTYLFGAIDPLGCIAQASHSSVRVLLAALTYWRPLWPRGR